MFLWIVNAFFLDFWRGTAEAGMVVKTERNCGACARLNKGGSLVVRKVLVGIALTAMLTLTATSAAQPAGPGVTRASHSSGHVPACGGVLIGSDTC